MFKQLAAIAAAAVLMTSCGDAIPAEPVGSNTPPTTGQPPAASPGENTGGFGAPAQGADEFSFEAPGHFVIGNLRLADNGCWYIAIDGTERLIVFPGGFTIPSDDGAAILGPEETRYGSDTAVHGNVHFVDESQIPGGADGRWGNYITFCELGGVEEGPPTTALSQLAVFDGIELATTPRS